MNETKRDFPAAEQPPAWVLLLFFACFLAWCALYLLQLRPAMNGWLAEYISSYPAMLHLIPMIGVPVVMGIAVGKLVALFRR